MENLLKSTDLPVISTLSSLFEDVSKEERRQRLVEALTRTEIEVDAGKRALSTTKDEIESVRVKYENLADLCSTMEQLKCSLEEHIKTVRLNESSFSGTAAVLEYDTAKNRTHALINFIKARQQLEHAKESLAESGEDQQRMYESLVEMQQSYETMKQFVPSSGDDKALEQLKDRYLGWQSAALVFAIKQADYEKLAEIQKAYEKLGRQDEFLGTFKRVSINCLKEYNLITTSVPSLITALKKEVEFVFTHNYRVLRLFMSEFAASELLTQALREGISSINLESTLATLVPEVEDPIDLIQKLEKIFKIEGGRSTHGLQEILRSVDVHILEKLVVPLRSALTTYSLAKVNSWEIKGTSFRTSLENFRVSITQLFGLFGDIVTLTAEVFDDKTKEIVEQPIEKTMENFLVKLDQWKYTITSSGASRGVDDLIEVTHTSGQFVSQMEQFKEAWQFEDQKKSVNVSIKGVLKWNRGVVEALVASLRTKCTIATNEMSEKMQSIKKTNSGQQSFGKLPSFSHAPNEYVTNVGQEMLQLFHRLEEIFLDAHIVNAFFYAHKKKYDHESLFKKLLSDISERIMTAFVNAVRPVDNLDPEVAKQFNADTVFLKDAFDDLRTGNTTTLQQLSDELRKRFDS